MATPTPNPTTAAPAAASHVSAAPQEPAFVSEARIFLKDTSSKLPKTVMGLERQMIIGDLLGRMDEGDKGKLHSLLNYCLTKMFTISASDIDMGGYGTQGYIWYRIFGSKKPDKTLGEYAPDDISVLVQSVIGDRQRSVLYENRNLDFSHMLYLDNGEFRRFRADAYFDLDQLALNMRAITRNQSRSGTCVPWKMVPTVTEKARVHFWHCQRIRARSPLA